MNIQVFYHKMLKKTDNPIVVINEENIRTTRRMLSGSGDIIMKYDEDSKVEGNSCVMRVENFKEEDFSELNIKERIYFCRAKKPEPIVKTISKDESYHTEIRIKNAKFRIRFNSANSRERSRGVTTPLEILE